MIWTAPLGAGLGSLSEAGLSPSLQASSLSIACAYLKSLERPAAMALTGSHCPGKCSLLPLLPFSLVYV